LTNSEDEVKTTTVGKPVASAAVNLQSGARDPSSASELIGVPGLAVEAASAAEWRELVAGGGERLTNRRSGLGTNVAAYEAHVNVCASLRKTSGNQPLNLIR
jgi:hypothetical protein